MNTFLNPVDHASLRGAFQDSHYAHYSGKTHLGETATMQREACISSGLNGTGILAQQRVWHAT